MTRKNLVANADSQTDDEGGANRPDRGVLLIVCLPLFFSVLNASAVTVLLPEIGRDLAVGTGGLGWLMTSYLLVYGVVIPFYGRIADLYGTRRPFLFGLIVFTLGSILSAIAPNYSLLLGARIIQAAPDHSSLHRRARARVTIRGPAARGFAPEAPANSCRGHTQCTI